MGLELRYIDGQTPLDEDEKDSLKIKSITTQGELDEFEQLNIEKAVEWTIHTNLKPERILAEKFIKDLHTKMYGDVWKWAGEFRTSEKNIGVRSYLIATQLKQLLDDALFWVKNSTYNAEELAIRFKHRLVSIHCFANGNGRHSRLMADLIMEKIYHRNFFSWGGTNLVKATKTRESYIKAIKKADKQDISQLIAFAKS